MDITKLKNLIKDKIKYIIVAIVIVITFIGFNITVNKIDEDIAIQLVNNDLLTRSIDQENYIINHKMVFNEKLLKENLDELLKANNIKIKTSVSVKDSKVYIMIGKTELIYEISANFN